MGGPLWGGGGALAAAFVAFVILKSLRGTQSGGCSESICPPPLPPSHPGSAVHTGREGDVSMEG